MPPSLSSLPLFDKQRNRITIWTGPGAAWKPALPFSCILCSGEKRSNKNDTNLPDRVGSPAVEEVRRAFWQRVARGCLLIHLIKEEKLLNDGLVH